jgi:hypothetical protein
MNFTFFLKKGKIRKVLFFRNGIIAPVSAYKGCTQLFFIKLFVKPYKGDTKINSKPPFQRQLAIPTRAMKGVTMNMAITLAIHQRTSSKTECLSKPPIGR